MREDHSEAEVEKRIESGSFALAASKPGCPYIPACFFEQSREIRWQERDKTFKTIDSGMGIFKLNIYGMPLL